MMCSQTYQRLKAIDSSDSISMHCFINCQNVSIAVDMFAVVSVFYFLFMAGLLMLLLRVTKGGKLFTITFSIQMQRYSDIVGFVTTFFNAALLGFAFGDIPWKLSVLGTIFLMITHVAALRRE